MKKLQFIYPAVFMKDEDTESFQVYFTDLNIYTSGKNLDEAYLNARNLLSVYFNYAVKYEIDVNEPSKLEKILEKCKENEIVMLIDALIEYQ